MEPSVLLFSYGTLQLPGVQVANYGRRLDGEPDALIGFRLIPIEIADPDVVRISGKAVHTIARASGDPEDRISGFAFLLTDAELETTDAYEGTHYTRVEVKLASGRRAFVYVEPERAWDGSRHFQSIRSIDASPSKGYRHCPSGGAPALNV